MSAPDYETLFNVEDGVEPGLVAALESKGLTVYRQRDRREVKSPRIEVVYINGGITGTRGRDSSGNLIYNTWNGSFNFRVVTNRVTGEAPTHQAYVAKLRLAMLTFRNEITPERFPYHTIPELLESGTQQEIDADDKQDITTITYTGLVSIRDSAWP